jgi:hypothetical protein
MDRAGNTASVNISINIDKTAPEAVIQIDPVTRGLQVFGRDTLAGVLPGAVAPLSVTIVQGATEQRTYSVTDLAGNTLTLVLEVKGDSNELKAEVISLQYNSGPILSVPGNKLLYDWKTNQNGSIKTLEQDLTIGSGSTAQEVDAEFRADRNETVITTKNPQGTTVQGGLVLLRLVSVQGQLVIEHN